MSRAPTPGSMDVLAGNPLALGRAITELERAGAGSPPSGRVAGLRDASRKACRVAVTGPSGAGKSSLIRELVRRVRAGGERAAVVACDPSSPVTGGAFLGDRLRLASLASDPGVFFRSLAHRGPAGEPSRTARLAADLLDAAGFPWVFLETVGSGQGDAGAFEGAHVKVLLHSADGGDEMQMLKAGIAEAADVHVVGKKDRPGTDAWARELEATLSAGAVSPPRVFTVSTVTGEGLDALAAELRSRRQSMQEGGAAQ